MDDNIYSVMPKQYKDYWKLHITYNDGVVVIPDKRYASDWGALSDFFELEDD